MDINLNAYFKRINYSGPAIADIEVLKQLHYLHPLSIPFENISPWLGLPLPLQLDQLQEKLVMMQRGGYCYEQNLLFKAVLTALGFKVTGLIARVRWNIGAEIVTPRSHMLLLVETGGETYLCDVGFGGLTLTTPLKLQYDLIQQTPHETFRIVKQNELVSLEVLIKDYWKAVYVLALDAQFEADYEVANWFMSTYPDSAFKKTLIIARPTSTGRLSLTNTELTDRKKDGTIHKQTLTSVTELLTAVKTKFSIELPNDIDLGNRLPFVS